MVPVNKTHHNKTIWGSVRKKQQKENKCLPVFRPPQPSFLTSHQKHDAATSVSIPVSASTHFRAISDSRPTHCDPQRGETSGHGETNGNEGVGRGARVGLSTTTEDGIETSGGPMPDFSGCFFMLFLCLSVCLL